MPCQSIPDLWFLPVMALGAGYPLHMFLDHHRIAGVHVAHDV